MSGSVTSAMKTNQSGSNRWLVLRYADRKKAFRGDDIQANTRMSWGAHHKTI